MNKVQKERCIRLSNYLQKKVSDDEYYHACFKGIHPDGRTTHCAAGFAVEKRKMFPGLKQLSFRKLPYMHSTGLQIFELSAKNDFCRCHVKIFENYFGKEAWNKVFSGWHTDLTRTTAIKRLRKLAK